MESPFENKAMTNEEQKAPAPGSACNWSKCTDCKHETPIDHIDDGVCDICSCKDEPGDHGAGPDTTAEGGE